MTIGVLKETAEHERRVALSPDVVGKLVKNEHKVLVQKGAGINSSYPDSFYEEAGAIVIPDRETILKESKIVVGVQTPPDADIKQISSGSLLICFIWALQNPDLVELLKEKEITALGMDAIPRISRAQSMDALSSMSNIAGYKASIIAADHLDKYFPMMMTAAGTIPPAKALILGAGVAGLQAIATCRRLGAVVEAFDVRPVVKEQVESLGAKFVDVPLEEEDTETSGGYAKELSEKNKLKQREVIHDHVKMSDIVITTALIPGRPAPLLITKEMVQDMKPGSVIVDLAAETGGNCELTEAGKTVVKHGVSIVGPINLPSRLSNHASQLYAKNMLTLLNLIIKEGELNLDFEDEIIEGTTITHAGEIITPMLKKES